MDDDYKDYRKSKPQQKLYKPGSGPLRRSGYAFDAKMDFNDFNNSSRSRDQNLYGSQNITSVVEDELSAINRDQYATYTRTRKPEQQLYVPRSGDVSSDFDRQLKTTRNDTSSHYNNRRMSNKQEKHGSSGGTGSYSRGASRREFSNKDSSNNDINYNRNNRQVSEPRSTSPAQFVQEQSTGERNRDSRSMEVSAKRHNMSNTGGKPPSGRRNSAGYPSDSSRQKYINLDNIPPRFRKNYLGQAGHHSFETVDQINKDKQYTNQPVYPGSSYSQNLSYNSNPNWSQTLPSRGRGRLRDNDTFDREKFIHSFWKNYEAQNSRRSTPSSSYLNLYEPNATDRKLDAPSVKESHHDHYPNDIHGSADKNGINNYSNDVSSHNHQEVDNHELDTHDDEPVSSSSTLLEMTNLNWTEEVEKNIKLDDMCDSSTSFSQSLKSLSVSHEVKASEPKESKRSGRGRRRDKRSLSRGKKNAEKKLERQRKDSNVSTHEEISNNNPVMKQIERERKDSHRSNRSSNIGNSRDDLDKWRSLRSFSREQSTEGRIVSQCNSRDVSTSRAVSPRDNDGFRIPPTVMKGGMWSATNQKNHHGSWASGRTSSIERGRQSPALSVVSVGGDAPALSEITAKGGGGGGGGGGGAGGGGGGGGGGRRSRKSRSGRRRGRVVDGGTPLAPPTHLPPGSTPAPTNINWRDEILESKKHSHDNKHPEISHQRNKLNSIVPDKPHQESSSSLHPGIIILPQNSIPHLQKDQNRAGAGETQKLLYDHHNPSKPIVVHTSPTAIDMRIERASEGASRGGGGGGGGGGGYDGGEAAHAHSHARHCALLQEVERADVLLQAHMLRGPLPLADHWQDVADTRKCLQNALQNLLKTDIKYCQAENVEHNFWKILYYHFIEMLRKSLLQLSPEDKPKIVKLINVIIEEGNTYFENLVIMLENVYKFSTDDYINDNHVLPPKGLGYVGLALISVQKIYVFLGDLARYKEQINETNNYAKSKLWYTKAQQINPKNGRPYNQLAILAIYARRKLDAVYYYMRSLMSSNPFQSARESLLSLFEENRKKYETAERKRRAALESLGEAEGGAAVGGGAGCVAVGVAGAGGVGAGRGLRREVWVRPSGRRTAALQQDTREQLYAAMTPVELNKNFITSYLHVHGKLITKIGMETFHESAAHMLQQYRALLSRQPLPTPAARLLQLTALNMYAVETAANSKDPGPCSGWLSCAVGVSLLMFGALLERCCALLPAPAHTQQHADALLLLPAIKVWSDWMLCHSNIWNPPPSFESFQIGSDSDPWDWLAKLMNILEDLDDKTIHLENEPKEGHVSVRLGEDASLGGFTPLMYMEPAAAWVRAGALPHLAAEHALRTRKLLFFGTEYLVGVEPPVLRLECPPDAPPRYVSAVQRAQPPHPPLQHLSEDSEDEESESGAASGATSVGETSDAPLAADEATRRLLRRKEQLEYRKASIEKRKQRMQEMVGEGEAGAGAEVEVRPRWLVPDTNCFIDHLQLLRAVAAAPAHPYLLVVPLVVMTELEGLRRCSRLGARAAAALAWAGGAGGAGAAVSGGGGCVRFATSHGSLLATCAFAERDALAHAPRATNDDRVLATALNLHNNVTAEADAKVDEQKSSGDGSGGAGARGARGARGRGRGRVREVVLLTEDRNLRVKALAAELPASDLPSFVRWAGLRAADDAPDTTTPETATNK